MRAVDPDLTQAEALALLQYEAGSGLLFWRKWRTHSACASKHGRIAGSIFDEKYIIVTIRKKRVLAHRLIWLMVHGEWPADHVDHIDGNGLNNRIENLRLATKAENCRNRRPISAPGRFRGVYKIKKKKDRHNQTKFWQVRIMVNWNMIYLGCFETQEEAIAARVEAEKKYYGEFSWEEKS